MNASQYTNLALKITVFAAGIAAAHGLGKYVPLITGQTTVGIVALILAWLVSHVMHADRASNPASGGGMGSVTLLFFAFGLSVMFTGCAGQSPVKATYQAETGTDTIVSAAMTAWGDYVAANHPPVSQELQVEALFDKIQSAEILVDDANAACLQTGGTNLVAAVASDTTAELQAVQDLLNTLKSFGVKL